MHKMMIQKAVGSLLLAAGLIAAPLSASAGTLLTGGVTFTFTSLGNDLTLQIDALNRGAINADGIDRGWGSATNIGALEVKAIGTFDWTQVKLTGDILNGTNTLAVGGPGGWSGSGNELDNSLNVTGCSGGTATGGVDLACFFAPTTGQRIPLADNMLFHFHFGGTPSLNFSDPVLKVAFYNGNDPAKTGDFLSQGIPAVPEPESYGMFIMGLGILAFLARPRKA